MVQDLCRGHETKRPAARGTQPRRGDETLAGADCSVCIVFGVSHTGDYYLLDGRRVRVSSPDLLRLAQDLIQFFQPSHTLVEEAANGTALYQELVQSQRCAYQFIKPRLDKESRLHAATPAIEAGRVHLPENAPWRTAFLNEVTGFPGSRHDDQVDSLSQVIN